MRTPRLFCITAAILPQAPSQRLAADLVAGNHQDKSNRRFNMYRWHITDPIYFKENIRVTIQALGWHNGGRYLPLQDDISSVAFWYSDNLEDVYPTLPDKDYLEVR